MRWHELQTGKVYRIRYAEHSGLVFHGRDDRTVIIQSTALNDVGFSSAQEGTWETDEFEEVHGVFVVE